MYDKGSRQWETGSEGPSRAKLLEICAFDVFDTARVGVGGKVLEGDGKTEDAARGRVVVNLHIALYGHVFVAMETTRGVI